MALIAKETGGGGFDPIPEGVHLAYCTAIIDIGEHHNETFKKSSRNVIVQWAVPDETILINGIEEPRIVSNTYTLSLGSKSNLRRDLEAWRGKAFTEEELTGFDLRNVLGVSCQIQIIHKTKTDGKVFAEISAVMALPKSMPKLSDDRKTITPFWFDLDESPLIEMDRLPQWIKDRIVKSVTYQQIINQDPDYTPEEHYQSAALSEEQKGTIFTAMNEWDNISEIEAALLSQFQIGDTSEITADQFEEAMLVIGRTGKQFDGDDDVPF